MSAEVCYRCRGSDIIQDHHSGDVVCRGCGEVQAERVPDESAEWNTYDESEGKGDPSRVGGNLDSAAARIWGAGGSKKRKRQNGMGAGDAAVNKKSKAQSRLERICMRLSDVVRAFHIDERVSQTAMTVADRASQEGALRGLSEEMAVAALLFISCRHCDVVTSIKEVAAKMGFEKYEVGKAINAITKKVPDLHSVVFQPEQVVDWCSGHLQLPAPVRTAANDIMKRAVVLLSSEALKAHALAGGVLLLLCSTRRRLDGLDKPAGDHPVLTVEEVEKVTHVSAAVLKKTYARLYEQKASLVTEEFEKLLKDKNLELTLI